MVIWCPDWPVRAAVRAGGRAVSEGAAVALLEKGAVYACSGSARSEGVRRGMRVRDAQSRCPDLVTMSYDPALDMRAFEPVLSTVEQLSPGVHVLRPGTCALRAKGSSRYYGGEQHVAAALAERLVQTGVSDCRFGVADDVFAAQQAAWRAEQQDSVVVAPGGSAEFLADAPISVLDSPELVSLLQRLGLRTLGAFAALPARDVLARFGVEGALAHRLASGLDTSPVLARRPPPELERQVDFEPALDRIETIAFSVRLSAEDFVRSLRHHQLVCTSLWVQVHTEAGEVLERLWLHPRWFDAKDLADRVRWQLQGSVRADGSERRTGAVSSELSAPICRIRLVPDAVAPLADHADGLWGGGPSERVYQATSRLQSLLGHEAVASIVLGGGRSPAHRQRLVPFGDKPLPRLAPEQPWPGSLPAPAPATVFDQRPAAQVLDRAGRPVEVTERGMLSDQPRTFSIGETGSARPVHAWAGPWPLDERWWDPAQARRSARLQVVGVDGSAWLLAVEDGRWSVEASYD